VYFYQNIGCLCIFIKTFTANYVLHSIVTNLYATTQLQSHTSIYVFSIGLNVCHTISKLKQVTSFKAIAKD